MNQSEKEKHWNISLIIILLVLGFVIIFELNMFISGVLGALTLYAMLRKRMFFLTETKKVKAPLASIILIITVILLVLIPFSLFILMVADKISTVHINFQALFEKAFFILYCLL